MTTNVETRSYSAYKRICTQYHYSPMSYAKWATWSITPLPDVSHIFAPRWTIHLDKLDYAETTTTVTSVHKSDYVRWIARGVADRSRELLQRLAKY